jgi:hypothetical protein
VAYGASGLKQQRGESAGVELWNALSTADDPSTLPVDIATSIRSRFGNTPEVLDGIKKAYYAYLSVRPSPLTPAGAPCFVVRMKPVTPHCTRTSVHSP